MSSWIKRDGNSESVSIVQDGEEQKNMKERGALNSLINEIFTTPPVAPKSKEKKTVKLPEEKQVKEVPSPDEEDKARQKAIRVTNGVYNELIETEKHFVKDMAVIVDIFFTPMKEKEMLDQCKLSNLFSNVEVLYSQVNTELLKQLIQLEETFKSGDLSTRLRAIGNIFVDFAPLFKLYAVYCSNQPNIHSRIIKFKEEDKNFALFLRRAERRTECRKLTLEAFLISPLQRLCKYPLLLREFRRCAPEDFECPELDEAIKHIAEIVQKVNERVRKIGDLNRLIAVAKDINMSKTCEFNVLGDHNRVFVLENSLMFGDKQMHGYLFSDVLLLAELDEDSGRFEVNTIFNIFGSTVEEGGTAIDASKTQYCILLTTDDSCEHVMMFNKKVHRQLWLDALYKTIKAAPPPKQSSETPRLANSRRVSSLNILDSFRSVSGSNLKGLNLRKNGSLGRQSGRSRNSLSSGDRPSVKTIRTRFEDTESIEALKGKLDALTKKYETEVRLRKEAELALAEQETKNRNLKHSEEVRDILISVTKEKNDMLTARLRELAADDPLLKDTK